MMLVRKSFNRRLSFLVAFILLINCAWFSSSAYAIHSTWVKSSLPISADEMNHIPAFYGALSGGVSLSYVPQTTSIDAYPYVRGFNQGSDRATYTLDVAAGAGGSYEVRIVYRFQKTQPYAVKIRTNGGTPITHTTVKSTGIPQYPLLKYTRQVVGTLDLQEGLNTVEFYISNANSNSESFNLQALEFIKVDQKAAIQARADAKKADTQWMIDGKYGLFTQWGPLGMSSYRTISIHPNEDPNVSNIQQAYAAYVDAVNAFDVEAFADMVEETGASWCFFTTSHGLMFIPGPIQAVENISPNRTTSRDLIMEVADALAARGIKTLLYFHMGSMDDAWMNAVGYKTKDKTTYFNNLTSILTEISTRYGNKVWGYFLDDFYKRYYSSDQLPLEGLFDALKTGSTNNKAVMYNINNNVAPSVFLDAMAEDLGSNRGYMGLPPANLFGPDKSYEGLTPHFTFTMQAVPWTPRKNSNFKSNPVDRVIPIDDGNADVVYTGSWSQQASEGSYLDTVKYSATANDSAAYTFVGNKAYVHVAKGPDAGKMDVYIDDVLAASDIDTYAAAVEPNALAFTSATLSAGTHTVKAVVKGTKSAASSGTRIYLDTLDYQRKVYELTDPVHNKYGLTNYFKRMDAADVPLSINLLVTRDVNPTINFVNPKSLEYMKFIKEEVKGDSVDDQRRAIAYTGNWQKQPSVPGAFEDTLTTSSTPGDYAEYTFEGKGLKLLTKTANNGGVMDIFIDNQLVSSFDSYSANPAYRVVAYETKSLAPGTHTVRVENASSSGSDRVHVDYIGVYDGVKIDDNNAKIAYSGSWNHVDQADNYYESVSYSGATNAAATYSFYGSEVKLVGKKGPGTGKVKIYIDDVQVALVDTYSAQTDYQQVLYENTSLATGTHTVKMVIAGQKNAASSGYSGQLDYIQTFDSTLGDGTTPPEEPPEEPPVGDTFVDDTDWRISYSEGWHSIERAQSYNGTITYTNTANASAEYAFEGTGVKLYTQTGPGAGIFDVYIDDVLQTNFDSYSSTGAHQVLAFDRQDLSPGEHTLKVVASGTKNASASGYNVHLDKIVVSNPEPAPTPTIVEDTDSELVYSGNWNHISRAESHGGTLSYSTAANASVTYAFDGTGVKLYTQTGPGGGKMDIYVDDVLQTTFDSYSSPAQHQALAFDIRNLPQGTHTIKMVVTGTKNPNATNVVCHLDYLEITT